MARDKTNNFDIALHGLAGPFTGPTPAHHARSRFEGTDNTYQMYPLKVRTWPETKQIIVIQHMLIETQDVEHTPFKT